VTRFIQKLIQEKVFIAEKYAYNTPKLHNALIKGEFGFKFEAG
jgi:hypothetical protein